MMASYCRPACVCEGIIPVMCLYMCVCVFSWLLFMFRIIIVILENCVKSSERASSVCCFRGCSFRMCVPQSKCVCVCVSVCSGQMVPDENYWWSSSDHYYWSVITVEKALLYSAGLGHEPTEGATVAHRGQTPLCVYSSVCDHWARTGINTKTHVHTLTHARKPIYNDGQHRHTHIIISDQKNWKSLQLSGVEGSDSTPVWCHCKVHSVSGHKCYSYHTAHTPVHISCI